ncbi:CAAX prenyl protease 1 homolog isoform X2 [Drosophila ficusphila]|nr:CAAX prenyl protease 1 homolog isoform X2 [Drosophila ficusphila]
MALEAESVWYFNLFVWLLLVVGSLLLLVAVGLFGVPCIGKSRELKDSDRSESLRKVLTDLKFPGRVYAVYTFHVGRPTAWVMGCFCCLRLDIHDNLTLNRGLGSTDLAFSHVGEGLNDEQLAAFVAHQLAHWHLWHSVKTLVMIHLSLLVYLVLFGFSYKWSTLYKAAGFSKLYPCVVGFWLVYKYLMRPFHTLTTWIVLFFIRHFEYAADAYIVKRGYGEGIRSALLKLFSDDFEFPYVDHWYLMWHLYRPSVLQRILNLERLEHKQRVSRLSLV